MLSAIPSERGDAVPTVDAEHHDLTFRIVVVGAESDAFTGALPLQGGELPAGEVQGWRPHFTFDTFPLDPWAADAEPGHALEKLVPYIDALVLTDAFVKGTHYSSEAVERLSRTLSPGKLRVPAAVYGGPALAQEWETLSGQPPLAVVDPEPANAMAIIKALAKALLRSKMKSTPPPPPVDK
jgi:hypothetical protein